MLLSDQQTLLKNWIINPIQTFWDPSPDEHNNTKSKAGMKLQLADHSQIAFGGNLETFCCCPSCFHGNHNLTWIFGKTNVKTLIIWFTLSNFNVNMFKYYSISSFRSSILCSWLFIISWGEEVMHHGSFKMWVHKSTIIIPKTKAAMNLQLGDYSYFHLEILWNQSLVVVWSLVSMATNFATIGMANVTVIIEY